MHFKLIIALTEDSITNKVVDAAREKGATGSTVISSARGEGIQVAKTFLGLSLETQRDVMQRNRLQYRRRRRRRRFPSG
jgi:phosphoglycerate dehydrogenase-like enzyme